MTVAKTQEAAQEAAEWLQEHAVTYEMKPQAGIVTLDDAIKKRNYLYDDSTHPSAPTRLLKVCFLIHITITSWPTECLFLYIYLGQSTKFTE